MKNLIPPFIHRQYRQNRLRGAFRAAALFVDISGFTRMTDALMQHGKEGTEVLSDILKYLFEPTVESIYAQGGFVTTYAGDAFTALFFADDDPALTALRALRAALEIQDFFATHNRYASPLGEFTFGAKAGLSFGDVEWGIVGTDSAKAYYFRGPAVDRCAEAEHYAEKGELWAGEAFLAQAADVIPQPADRAGTFARIRAVQPFNLPPLREEPEPLSEAVVIRFTGEQTFHFPEGEFRDVVVIFISFEQVPDLDAFMQTVFELQERYRCSHPALDFGDKGGKVLLFSGAPVAYENKETRALQFVTDLQKRTPQPARLRIGITQGTVYAGFYGAARQQAFSCLGSTVNQAARFMMKAGWGQVLADERAAQAPRFHFRHLGDFAYKGRMQKIPTYELTGEAAAASHSVYSGVYRSPLQMGSGTVFVGRERELAALFERLKPLGAGRFGGVVYVDGEPGLGKSRLVQEFQHRLFGGSDAYRWFHLPCDEIFQQSLHPVVHFLNEYFDQNSAQTPDEKRARFETRFNRLFQKTRLPALKRELKRTRSILGALVGVFWEGSLYSQLDAQARYENTLDAVKTLFKAESSRSPVIVELEDGHWADDDTLAFLRMLTRNVQDYPFILLTTCRFHDDGSVVDFGLEDVPAYRLRLEAIGAEAIRYMVAPLLNREGRLRPVPAETLDFIYRRGEGNPFFVEQISLYLKEHNLLDDSLRLRVDPDAPDISIHIPATITDVLIARIDRLATGLKEIVKTASVLGREFAVTLLSEMLLKMGRYDSQAIRRYLSAGQEEAVWETVSEIRYIFRHGLIRDAVYEMQLKKQLRALHKLAAETIEELYADDLAAYAFELAEHYERAELPEKAVFYLKQAADFARDAYRNQEALHLYDRLLRYPLKPADEFQTLRSRGRVLETIGDWENARSTYQRLTALAERSGTPRQVAEALNALGWLAVLRGNPDEAKGCARRAYRICTEINDRRGQMLALKIRGALLNNEGRSEAARQAHVEALAIAEEMGDLPNIVAFIFQLREYLMKEGDLLETFQRYEQLARQAGDRRTLGRLYFFMGDVCLLQEDYEGAQTYNHKLHEAVRELGDKQGMCYAIGDRGIIYAETGRLKEAIDCYREKLEIAEEMGDGYNQWEGWINMGAAYLELRDYPAAGECIRNAIEISRKNGLRQMLGIALLAKVSLLLEQGGVEQAQQAYAEAAPLVQEIGGDTLSYSAVLLKCRLDFLSEDSGAVERLEALLRETDDNRRRAEISFRLWEMTRSPRHRTEALERNRTLYERTHRHLYKTRLETLQSTA